MTRRPHMSGWTWYSTTVQPIWRCARFKAWSLQTARTICWSAHKENRGLKGRQARRDVQARPAHRESRGHRVNLARQAAQRGIVESQGRRGTKGTKGIRGNRAQKENRGQRVTLDPQGRRATPAQRGLLGPVPMNWLCREALPEGKRSLIGGLPRLGMVQGEAQPGPVQSLKK